MCFFQPAFPSEAVSRGRRPAFSGLKQMLFPSAVPFLLIPPEAQGHIWLSGATLQQSSPETMTEGMSVWGSPAEPLSAAQDCLLLIMWFIFFC